MRQKTAVLSCCTDISVHGSLAYPKVPRLLQDHLPRAVGSVATDSLTQTAGSVITMWLRGIRMIAIESVEHGYRDKRRQLMIRSRTST